MTNEHPLALVDFSGGAFAFYLVVSLDGEQVRTQLGLIEDLPTPEHMQNLVNAGYTYNIALLDKRREEAPKVLPRPVVPTSTGGD